MVKPTIGLNCDVYIDPSAKRLKCRIGCDYTDSVRMAGGIPVVLPATDDPDHIDEQLDLIGGLILVGGRDYDPSLYGAKRHAMTRLLHPRRAFYDLELARAALRRKLPILGICGGHQLINIVFGGTLIQHLPDAVATSAPHRIHSDDAAHDVVIEPGTLLARILGPGTHHVNSAHHQAVANIGAGLHPSAQSSDGVIEAIEGTGEAFLLGIQWHPERLAARRPDQLAIFSALIAAARGEPPKIA